MKAQLKRASSVFLRGNSRGSAAVSIHTYLGQLKAQEIKFYDAESSRVALAAKLAIWPFDQAQTQKPTGQCNCCSCRATVAVKFLHFAVVLVVSLAV